MVTSEEHQIIEGGGAIIIAIMRNVKCMTSCPFPIPTDQREEEEGRKSISVLNSEASKYRTMGARFELNCCHRHRFQEMADVGARARGRRRRTPFQTIQVRPGRITDLEVA